MGRVCTGTTRQAFCIATVIAASFVFTLATEAQEPAACDLEAATLERLAEFERQMKTLGLPEEKARELIRNGQRSLLKGYHVMRELRDSGLSKDGCPPT